MEPATTVRFARLGRTIIPDEEGTETDDVYVVNLANEKTHDHSR